ncbi:MAG: GNAT family N-acetyltransferase [Ruminococcaceae bacterium]|nr:GNAT family N-acetyltransferase [Oscillospiraceae bacterium]
MFTHKGTCNIKTPRLCLRQLTIADASDFFYQLVNDKQVLKYTAWPYHEDIAQTENMLSSWEKAYERPAFYNWGIEYKGKIIGNITVYRLYEDTAAAEIGYCFGSDYWNQGFATEAAKAVMDYLFHKIGAEKIIISFADKNPASGRVAEKCGMTYVQTLPRAFTTSENEVVDIIEYSKNRCVD